MMFFTKLKRYAVVMVAGAAVCMGAALSGANAHAGEGGTDNQKRITVKDTAGKKWVLHDWVEGTRPYPKDLKKREAWYKDKWGESWAGPKHYARRRNGIIMSPGKWAYDVILLKGVREKYLYPFYGKNKPGKTQLVVYAPGGGENVTDIYVAGGQCIINVNPKTHAYTIIGTKADDFPHKLTESFKGFPQRSPESVVDGLGDKVQIQPLASPWAGWMTADPVTGRIYFVQRKKKSTLLRYVEKLLPYKVDDREMLLPAFLDWNGLYKKVGAELVMKNGKRAKPRFAVRTTAIKNFVYPGVGKRLGRKVLLSPDGKSVWAISHKTKDLSQTHLVEIETGKIVSQLKVATLPKGSSNDAHEGNGGGRFDGHLYFCRHTGCSGGQGRMFSLDPKSGKVSMLYDSLSVWPWKPHKPAAIFALQKEIGVWYNGPADAATLVFETTCFLFQCPRTGAVTTGGWDDAGFRRYHDGFVTALAMGEDCRPEWKGQPVACVRRLQFCPDVAPNGDVWLFDILYTGYLQLKDSKRAKLGVKEDMRIVRFRRTDWPEKQPVNGYANKFLSPKKREALMLEYAKKHITNYAELSKIY